MVQRAPMCHVISHLRRTMLMRLCCMSHTRQHASNTNNRPSLASTNNGEFGLSCTMSHEAPCHMGRVPSPACVAPCAHALCYMSHAEKAWYLRAPHPMCPSHAHGRYRRLHRTASPQLEYCTCSICNNMLTAMLHARCNYHTRHTHLCECSISCMLHHAG
jgi:hypothetical protein